MTDTQPTWPGYTPPEASRGATEEVRVGLMGDVLMTRVINEETTEPDPAPAPRPLFHEHGQIVGAEFGTPDDPDHGTVVRVLLDREDARIGVAAVHVTTEYPTLLERIARVQQLRDWWERRVTHLETAGYFDEARGVARCLTELNEAAEAVR